MLVEALDEAVEPLPGAGGKAASACFLLCQHHQGRDRQWAFGG